MSIEKFGKITDRMLETYTRKNHDYGNAFSDLYKEFGMVYPVIHLKEKLNRIQSLTDSSNEVNGESLEDSLLDIANYAVMTLVELEKEKE